MAGGYYNGVTTMFLPMTSRLTSRSGPTGWEWEWMGALPKERKWGPAMGSVDGVLTIAGGFDYGDETMDEFDPEAGQWIRSESKKLAFKREFASHTTVPHYWFKPWCGEEF